MSAYYDIDLDGISVSSQASLESSSEQISGDTGSDEWSRLAAGHGIYLSRAFLASVEASPRTRPTYLAARANGRLLGVLPTYVLEAEQNQFYDLRTWIGAHLPDPYPALLLGARTGYYNGLLLDPDLTAAQEDAVLDALLGSARDLARSTRARSMAFCHLKSASWLQLQQYQLRRGRDLAAATWLSQISMSIGLQPFTGAEHPLARLNTENDFLAWLGHDRSNKLRRQTRKFTDRGYEIVSCPVGEAIEETGYLLGQLASRHRTRPTDWTGYVAGLARHLGAAAHAFVARLDGASIACSICLISADAVHVRAYGAVENLRSGEYFELAYRLPIRYALGLGIPAIELGPEAYVPKLLRGATPIPLWTVVIPTQGDHAVSWSAQDAASQRGMAADTWRKQFGSFAHRACVHAVADLGRLPGNGCTRTEASAAVSAKAVDNHLVRTPWPGAVACADMRGYRQASASRPAANDE
jgi:uncharacterized protein